MTLLPVALLTVSAPAVWAQSTKSTSAATASSYVAGQLLVRFAPTASAAAKTKLLAQVGGKVTQTFSTGWQLLEVASTESAVKKLQGQNEVAALQPNYRVTRARPVRETASSSRTTQGVSTRAANPNDPQYPLQWALQTIGAPQAWRSSVGSNDVVVAVLDGAILTTHKDLAANIWTNTKEIPGNGIDDDKNGYVDDVHGWSAFDNSSKLLPDDHGTHCAGIIGATGNNRVGITGTNWRVKMVSVGCFSNGHSSSAAVIRGIDYILALRKKGVNVRAVNCSFGSNNFNGLPEAESFRALSRAGVLILRAAGNTNENLDLRPDVITGMKLPNLISIGASDVSDSKAVFSTYGPKTVDIFAPGRGIISTIAASDTAYDNFSGTSMATPYVAGAAALLWATQPNLTAAQVKARLLASATRVEKLRPYVTDGRRLNVGGLVNNAVHTIRGVVTAPLGPNTERYIHLGGVPVYLDNNKTPAAISDARGNYSISGVTGGNHTVKAAKSGLTFPAPTPVALPTDKAAPPAIFTVNIKALSEQKRLYTITGLVRRTAPDFGNTPVANVDIYVNDSSTPIARSDKDGKFKIERLTEGSYSVKAVDSATGEVAPDVKYVYLPYTPFEASDGNTTVTFTLPVATDRTAPWLTPSNTPVGLTYTVATAPKSFEGSVTDASNVDYVYAEMYRNNGVVFEMYDPALGKWVDAADYAIYGTIYGNKQKNPKSFNWKFDFPKLEAGYAYGMAVNAIDVWGNYTQAYGSEELYVEFNVVAPSANSGTKAKSSVGASAGGA